MSAVTIADRCIRIAAALAAIAFLPVVLFVGIMANDSGTAAGERASLIVLSSGSALAGWVLIGCVVPNRIYNLFRRSAALGFVVVTLPRYVFAVAGLSWCVLLGYSHLRVLTLPKEEVQANDAAYPQVNQHATQAVQITGTLPSTVPISSVMAVYVTDAARDSTVSGPCGRLHSLGPKELWYTAPLTKKDVLPISVSGGRYRTTAYLDRYLPGQCNWHLTQLYYPLDFKDHALQGRPAAEIEVRDESHRAADAARGEVFDQGPGRIWCGKGMNHAVTPYFPVVCNDYVTFLPRIPAEVGSQIPSELKGSHNPVFVLLGVRTMEFDFYDVDERIATSTRR